MNQWNDIDRLACSPGNHIGVDKSIGIVNQRISSQRPINMTFLSVKPRKSNYIGASFMNAR